MPQEVRGTDDQRELDPMSGCLLKFPGQAEVSPVLHFSRYEDLDVDEQIPLRAENRTQRLLRFGKR